MHCLTVIFTVLIVIYLVTYTLLGKESTTVVTLDPEEGYATWREAECRYQEQLRHRAKLGFVHALAVDPFNPAATSYRVLDQNG